MSLLVQNILAHTVPVRSLNTCYMVASYKGVEVIAYGTDEDKCRDNFEAELAYLEDLLSDIREAV